MAKKSLAYAFGKSPNLFGNLPNVLNASPPNFLVALPPPIKNYRAPRGL